MYAGRTLCVVFSLSLSLSKKKKSIKPTQARKFRTIIADRPRRRTAMNSRTRHVLETERSCVRQMRIVLAKRSRVMMVSVDERVHETLREDATTIESVFRTTVRVWDHPFRVRPRLVPWIDPYDVKPMPSVAARLRVTEETHVRKIALNCASQTSTASRTWVCVTVVERVRRNPTHLATPISIANPTRVFVENVTRARRHV